MNVDELVAGQDEAVAAEQWDLAIDLGERILALTPGNGNVAHVTGAAYNERADKAMKAGDYSRALVDQGRAVDLIPYSAAPLYNRAAARYQLTDYVGALDDVSRAIALDANDSDFFVLRGRCHRALAKPTEALADYMRAFQVNPGTQDAELLTEHGLTLVELDRGAEAIAIVERDVGLQFPPSLSEHFLHANGGRPRLNVYEDESGRDVGVVVSEWLPLWHEGETAIVVYKDHVLKKALVPRHFFPFALEPSGDHLYVDCTSANAMVYQYRHDTAFEPLIPFGVGIEAFCTRLKPGGQCPPEGYVFHYLDDYDPTTNKGTIQVVQMAAHRRCTPHFGGMKQYELAHGTRYKS